jgi:hypothetical protein
VSLRKKMGNAHEAFLLKLLGGRKTKASGAIWNDQMDGRHNRLDVPFAFAWDGKSTLAKSIGVSLAMWEKAREQAAGERPLLALRYYSTEKLDVISDLVVLDAHDFAEMLEKANEPPSQEPIRIFAVTRPDGQSISPSPSLMLMDGEMVKLDGVLYDARLGHPSRVIVTVNNVETDLGGLRVDIYVDNRLQYCTGSMERMKGTPWRRMW